MRQRLNKVINRWSLMGVVAIMLAIVWMIPSEARQEGIWTYDVYDGEVIITACDRTTSGEIVIPETLSGYPVTSIRTYAFNGCTELTGISFPSSINSIGNYAFSRCSGLTSINIPEGVTSIGAYAFDRCTGLMSISIPSSVTNISTYMFNKCTSLKSISIPEGVTNIEEYAFNGCTGLTSISISPSVKSIGSKAFYDCSGLTEVNITDLKAWCTIAFSWQEANPCYYAKKLKLNGQEITELTIPEGVTSVGRYAFYNCKGIKSINIPTSLESVGSYAFGGCNGVTEVNITDLVSWCGIDFNVSESNPCYFTKKLMLNGEEITELVIPEGVTSVGEYAFSYCSGLTSVSIPSSVTTIGRGAFRDCSGLSAINIPSNVKKIGPNAFTNCKGLTEVDTTDLKAWLGVEFGDDYANPCFYAEKLMVNGKEITELIVPEEITTIGAYAMAGYKGLTKVTIPEGVTTISSGAFRRCENLTNINIPSSVTYIGHEAFYNCTNLQEVNITNLKAWCEIEFYSSSANPCYYAKKLKVNGEEITELTIPEGITNIRSYTFYGYKALTSVIIPEGVKSIDEQVFAKCSNLTSINIPSGVTSIGSYAFYQCTELLWVRIPSSVTYIGWGAFDGCDLVLGIKNPDILDNYCSDGDEYIPYVLEPSSISMKALPNKLEYCVNEAFVGDGLAITAHYYDGTSKTITSGYKVAGFDSSQAGTCKITVEYLGETTSFEVTILGDVEIEEDLPELSIYSVTLQLENDISVMFKAKAENIDGIYTDVYVEVIQKLDNGKTKSETIKGALIEDGLYYAFKYSGVNAKEVGDLMDITIYGYRNGSLVTGGTVEDYSVMTYCLRQLEKTAEELEMTETRMTALKTLLVDLVNYASEAQLYFGYKTDALVSSQLSAEQKSYASADSAIEGMTSITNANHEIIDNPTVTWKSVALLLEAKTRIRIKVTYASNVENVKLYAKVGNAKFYEVKEYEKAGENTYYFYFDNMNAYEFSKSIDFYFVEGNTVISNTLRYSVESYATKKLDEASIGGVVGALMKYGKAAKAFGNTQ